MKTFRTFVLAVVVVAGATLSGCTHNNHDLPSLSSPAAPTVSTDVESIARAYYDCMTDAGIHVELDQNDHGQLAVVQFTGANSVMWHSPNGNEGFMSSGSFDQKAMDEFLSGVGEGEAKLMIDGVDRSSEYGQCLTESGYDEVAAWGDTTRDPAQTERQVTANNKWAECARENGWPDIQDSTLLNVVDWPTIVLPITITDDQLRLLLDACPNFDPDQQAKLEQWWQDNPTATSYPDDYLPDPSISFDIPWMAGGQGPDWTPSPQEQADIDRMNHLNDILNEQMNEYNEQQGG